ncbi:MAG: hypothetical protein IPJ12_10635 [Betaproteobacteria bacterium]|nr:hypothetical protein [Betaproteobacteria bacterium]
MTNWVRCRGSDLGHNYDGRAQVAGKPGNLSNSPLFLSGDGMVMETSTNTTTGALRLRYLRLRVVDIRWMLRSARLPGRAGSVAVALWAAVTASGQPTVTLTPARLREVGVGRESAYAAVERMVEAGMVVADRHRGRVVQVTLLDVTGAPVQVRRVA